MMGNEKMDIQNAELSGNIGGEVSKLKESLKESFKDGAYYGVVDFSLIVLAELHSLISWIIESSAAYQPVEDSSLNKG
jgi:hypothetical protein